MAEEGRVAAEQSNNPEEIKQASQEEDKNDEGMEERNQGRTDSPRDTGRREEFYLRYYVGHKGKFGHEFFEFEFRDDGRLRYCNNSQYKAENLIRKEVFVNEIVVD